jgi:hypothetical protein
MSCKKISDLKSLHTMENIAHPGKTHDPLDREMV